MNISCQFATSLRSAEHIAAAEAMGYKRAWLFDTPAQSADVWAMLALAVQQTRRIGLGPGVLVPRCAIQWSMPPGRRCYRRWRQAGSRSRSAPGSTAHGPSARRRPPGHTSRTTCTPSARCCALKRWNGTVGPSGCCTLPITPHIELTVLISALGPKELAITHEIADGLFSVNNQTSHAREFPWATLGIHGTVVEDNEPLDSARVRAAAGPGLALAYRATYEFGGDVTQLPGGQNWLKVINAQPNATSQCTTNTSSDSTRPTKQRGPPGVGELSPPRPSPGRLRASPNNSPTTPIKASPKSSTNPRGPTSPASSNALSPSPKKPNRHFNREEWS